MHDNSQDILKLTPPGKTSWPWIEEKPPLLPTMPDGGPWPKISIVTPSLNQGQYIEETIRSVLLQGYPNLEYIIVDGGSTDGSVEIIKKYESWLAHWVSEPDRGQSHAINKGFEKCTGDIMNWLNSDDYFLPEAFFRLANQYRKRSNELFVIGGNALVLDIKGELVERLKITPALELETELGVRFNGGIQASWFMSKALFEEIGYLDESLHYAMDIDYSIRWARKNPEYLIEEEPIAVFRIQPNAKTRKFIDNALIERRDFYIKKIQSKSISKSKKKSLLMFVDKNISGFYITRLGSPINFKFLIKAIYLYPKRIFTKDFWITIFDRNKTCQ